RAARAGHRASRSPTRWRARRRPGAATRCRRDRRSRIRARAGPGSLDSNHSESWIAVQPGTENLVGSSKFFFGKYSRFYDHYLGSSRILGGQPADNNQVQGYDCVSTGTQAMPPSWTNVTDPNVAFDTRGRVYQTTLPFNAFWGGSTLHPDGAIDVSYSDDMGQHWVKGNGGQDLEQSPNASARQAGHVGAQQGVGGADTHAR